MPETISLQKMNQELQLLKQKVAMLEKEVIIHTKVMTPEEEDLLEQARQEHAEGRTVSLEQLKEELGDN